MKEAPAGTECTCGSRLAYASGHDVSCPVYKAAWSEPEGDPDEGPTGVAAFYSARQS